MRMLPVATDGVAYDGLSIWVLVTGGVLLVQNRTETIEMPLGGGRFLWIQGNMAVQSPRGRERALWGGHIPDTPWTVDLSSLRARWTQIPHNIQRRHVASLLPVATITVATCFHIDIRLSVTFTFIFCVHNNLNKHICLCTTSVLYRRMHVATRLSWLCWYFFVSVMYILIPTLEIVSVMAVNKKPEQTESFG